MKKNLLVLCGGQSSEHEVSLVSAKSVAKEGAKDFNIIVVVIGKDGLWRRVSSEKLVANENYTALETSCDRIVFTERDATGAKIDGICIDIVFPILHGPTGEDGVIQGFLDTMGVPYVGCDVFSSSVCMNKVATKRILESSGINTVPFMVTEDFVTYDDAKAFLKSDAFFVKPISLGSSVGIGKITSPLHMREKMAEAFKYGREIIIEKAINAREIEVAVLGNEDLIISEFAEIIPSSDYEFYSYEAKYIDPDGAALVAPANLSEDARLSMREIAIKTFKVLSCSGMARIDFFICNETGNIYLNEVNTIPGFTPISMYPRLLSLSGISYRDLVSRLVCLALDKRALKIKYEEAA